MTTTRTIGMFLAVFLCVAIPVSMGWADSYEIYEPSRMGATQIQTGPGARPQPYQGGGVQIRCNACMDPNAVRYGQVEPLPEDSSHYTGHLLGTRLHVPVDTTLIALAVIGRKPGAKFQLALYSDGDNVPLYLRGFTPITELKVGIQEIGVPPVRLPAGYYWLVGTYDTTASIAYSQNTSETVKHITHTFGEPLPEVFGSASTYTGQTFSHYIVTKR